MLHQVSCNHDHPTVRTLPQLPATRDTSNKKLVVYKHLHLDTLLTMQPHHLLWFLGNELPRLNFCYTYVTSRMLRQHKYTLPDARLATLPLFITGNRQKHSLQKMAKTQNRKRAVELHTLSQYVLQSEPFSLAHKTHFPGGGLRAALQFQNLERDIPRAEC